MRILHRFGFELLVIVVFVLAMCAMAYSAALPIVYESYSTGQCKRVDHFDGSPYNCKNLPPKYHHVWTR